MTVQRSHKEGTALQENRVAPLSPALAYHAYPSPGKFATIPTKKLSEAGDLALAYSPGVAEACDIIARYPEAVSDYTMRQHLVAVISNGTAVLGLGNIGPLAAKPVMEGKAVLFQVFSGLNAIDLEINEQDPEKLIDIIASLAPSFGAINLEDIKAPECFRIESALKERLDIPVFHDDQHGTAITVSAAILNALELVGKTLQTSRCVVSGAGAGALACVGLLVELGMPKANITLCDTKGVIHTGRQDLSEYKQLYARETAHRSLMHAMDGADIFLGLSGPATVTSEMVSVMANRPIVFALANPIPEIWPHEVLQVKPDAYVGTGRSDLPNQVNNVLCFPYIFRGAMDAGAGRITLAMKKACVSALSQLAKEGFVDLMGCYNEEIQDFGPNYFIPKPFDLRLGVALPLAVAGAAIESGEAAAFDLGHYRGCLIQRAYSNFFVFRALYGRIVSSNWVAPKLGYIIETKDGGIPHSVRAAARVMKSYGLAQPYFIGHRAALLAQLRGDSVLAQAPVYGSDEYFEKHPASEMAANPGRYIRVTSEQDPKISCAQGWMHNGQLHIYSEEKPSVWMLRMLEACGCVFSPENMADMGALAQEWVMGKSPSNCGPEGGYGGETQIDTTCEKRSHLLANPDGVLGEAGLSESDPAVGGLTHSGGSGDVSKDGVDHLKAIKNHSQGTHCTVGPLRPMNQPHFGGLKFSTVLPTLWHCATAPGILGDGWFGPIALEPDISPSLAHSDNVHRSIETSSWALLMQEISP